MDKYPKIQSLYKRDKANNYKTFLDGEFSTPQIESLKMCQWDFTEKVDGTNIRIGWNGERVQIGGRTDRAQIPVTLIDRLHELFPPSTFDGFPTDITLYGEGYGRKIQKGGGLYKPDGVDFIMFDAVLNGMWQEREHVDIIGGQMGVSTVRVIARGTLFQMVDLIIGQPRQASDINPGATIEGLVARPSVMMFTRGGKPIMTKLKYRDFPELV